MLTILGGLVRFPFPGTTVMLTLQTLFVILSGLVLGAYDGAFAQVAYMLLGLVGLPIFTSVSGFGAIFSPTFGYIFSFWIAAAVSGALVRRLRSLNPFKVFACGIAGILINYAIGIPYQVLSLMFFSGTNASFAAAMASVPSVLIMFVKDAVLLYLICLIYPRLMSMLKFAVTAPKPALQAVLPAPVPKDPDGKQGGNEGEEKKKEKDKNKQPLPEPSGMNSANRDFLPKTPK